MLRELFSNLVNAINSFFVWLYNIIVPFFTNLLTDIWNHVIAIFWSWYARVISWFVSAIVALFPDDTLDFNANVEALVQYIAGWDLLLPIHETFLLLNILLTYHLVKITVRYSAFLISMLRKFIPT